MLIVQLNTGLFEHFFRFSPGMILALTHHPFDAAVYDQHRTRSARSHSAVDRRPCNRNAQFGCLADCILLGMNGTHTMTGDRAVFVGDILHLVPGLVTVRKARRGADIAGYQYLFASRDNTAAFTSIAGRSLRDRIGVPAGFEYTSQNEGP